MNFAFSYSRCVVLHTVNFKMSLSCKVLSTFKTRVTYTPGHPSPVLQIAGLFVAVSVSVSQSLKITTPTCNLV